MTPTITSTRQLEARCAPIPLGDGPILLASDGRESTEPALRATRQLATRLGREVHVVGIVEPGPPLFLPPEVLMQPVDTSATLVGRTRQRITAQLRQDLGDRPGWRAEVRRGIPAQAIAAVANECNAGMIVTGLSPHPVVDRIVGSEVPVELSRLTDRPLLAVAPGWERLPRTIVITVDMSGTSERVARFAGELFPDATTVYLVHVMPRQSEAEPEAASWEAMYERELAAAYARVRATLPATSQVETVTLRGNVAGEVSDFAEYAKADLLVSGVHAHGMFYRMFFGNVATKLLRAATTSVLLVPEGDLAASPLAQPLTVTLPRDDWGTRLRDFTRRNAGRRIALEIDERDVGAAFQAYDYPVLGASFDHRDDRVQLMLGEGRADGRQLTHTIGRPRSIDVMTAPHGRDSALRVAYEGGQALLLFLVEEHTPAWTSEG